MRVIHGIWADQALGQWAEDPGLPRVPHVVPREARPQPIAGPHPFACQADSDPWRAEFALRSAEDPSLMVPAADLWAGEGAALAGLASRDPVEELLAGLGAAARLFAELEDALREPAPALVELDTPGAFRFLKQTGPLLSGAGFGVLLPDWVRKARLGLKLTTRSRSTSGSSVTPPKFGLGDPVDFRYEAAVGGQPLDPADLAELARLKVPLVRLRAQRVELDEAHVRAAPDTRTRCWTTRRPTSGLDPSLPCVSITRQGCLACW
jgi:SNF2 Helicase protein